MATETAPRTESIVADPLLDGLTAAFTAILRDPAIDSVRLGVAIATEQKTTLSRGLLGSPQRA